MFLFRIAPAQRVEGAREAHPSLDGHGRGAREGSRPRDPRFAELHVFFDRAPRKYIWRLGTFSGARGRAPSPNCVAGWRCFQGGSVLRITQG